MVTLTLLRHAKSDWEDASLDDFDRPLAPRGAAAAPVMGRYLARAGIEPDLVLCSPSLRTRQTLDLVLPEMGRTPGDVVYDECLYHGAPTVLLARLRRVGQTAGHVMLVGHNPGLQALALDLTGSGSKALIAALAARYPTCAVAVIEFERAQSWGEVQPASGALRSFVTPRTVDATGG